MASPLIPLFFRSFLASLFFSPLENEIFDILCGNFSRKVIINQRYVLGWSAHWLAPNENGENHRLTMKFFWRIIIQKIMVSFQWWQIYGLLSLSLFLSLPHWHQLWHCFFLLSFLVFPSFFFCWHQRRIVQMFLWHHITKTCKFYTMTTWNFSATHNLLIHYFY